MNTRELLQNINHEDTKVAKTVSESIPSITNLVDIISEKISNGGRLFYIGSGTSGRLGILDASECPPTFGVSNNIIIGIIAGGDRAIRSAVESAEDNNLQAWEDLKKFKINKLDIVIGISASGTTPYVVGGLKKCQENNISTACITCNQNMEIKNFSNHSIELLVGPEFITGSTRMKAGTAQKMTLNMISTAVMIKMGHVVDNKMIDMHINNNKLEQRGIQIIMNKCKVDKTTAKQYLHESGSVRLAITKLENDNK